MSKIIKTKITCPNCEHQFIFDVYRSIWGEYPENRELVMTDQINVATCNNCNSDIRLGTPLFYTNADQQFAVWWEPYHDPQIDEDAKGYAQFLGERNYLAAAPRVQEWRKFKQTIMKFESGKLKANPVLLDESTLKGMRDFSQSIQNEKKQGCMTLFTFILSRPRIS